MLDVYLDKYRHPSNKGPNVVCTSVSGAMKTVAANEQGYKMLSTLCFLWSNFNLRVIKRFQQRETRVTSELRSDFEISLAQQVQVLHSQLSALVDSHPHLAPQVEKASLALHA